MTTLAELRRQRADAETQFQASMQAISSMLAPSDMDLIAKASGYHREVTALYATELSLISDGKIPDTTPSHES